MKNIFKNKKVVLIIIAVVVALIIAASIFLVIRYKNVHKVNGNVAITALTEQDITRLQSYPYWFGKPVRDFDNMSKEFPELGVWIKDTLLKNVMNFEQNEKFFTSEKLAYKTNDYHYAIRGVLQVKLSDGRVTEQDVEYEYRLGDWNEDNSQAKIYFEGKRFLNSIKVIGGE